MLYVLPPPSAPSPPSPWVSIRASCNNGNAKNVINKSNSTNSINAAKCVVKNSACHKVKMIVKSLDVMKPQHRTCVRKSKEPGAHQGTGGGEVGESGGGGGEGGGPATDEEDGIARTSRSLSECYFASKGTALVLPPNESQRPASRRVSAAGSSDIQQHLQSMFYLLRPEETLKMAVKLESAHPGRTRYLVVVSRPGGVPTPPSSPPGGSAGRSPVPPGTEESCLLGIDCNERTTVGLVLRVLADTAITLDGDGGFSVSVCGQQHIFKPVSVQAMWSALQTLHKVSSKAREHNYFLGGLTHEWATYYEQRVDSERSCLNEWHAMDSLESRRPPSPDSLRSKPRERDETETVIRSALKEIMMSVDLDEVTCKYIRSRLEEHLDMDLGEFKPFIDQEMLTILGQMDAATEVFDHVFLGSEWNASNLEELQKNGVGHILNVTREIDNFFPGMFDYLNVRVYDDEKTDLLRHWDNTFRYISRARQGGSKVLVHCKMGVSRSASVVIAYAMKAYNWDLKRAMDYVKDKRSCIKPNSSFMTQLETYQGILDAMKNKERLLRSKSETNLKSPSIASQPDVVDCIGLGVPLHNSRLHVGPLTQLGPPDLWNLSGQDLARSGAGRPKSWSPENTSSSDFFAVSFTGPTSLSMEHLSVDGSSQDEQDSPDEEGSLPSSTGTTKAVNMSTPAGRRSTELELPASRGSPSHQHPESEARNYNLNVRMPCGNGQAYSVSQNKVVFLPSCQDSPSSSVSSVKLRVTALESQQALTGNCKPGVSLQVPDRKGLVLNLTSQFEAAGSKPGSPEESSTDPVLDEELTAMTQTKLAPQKLQAILVKKEIWDPAEHKSSLLSTSPSSTSVPSRADVESLLSLCASDPQWASTLTSHILSDNKPSSPTPVPKVNDPFSAQLDRVFDREERRQQRLSTSMPVEVSSSNTSVAPQDKLLAAALSSSMETALPTALRDCPSRQSSWSSYDSAVVLGYQGEPREAPSRQSSWGSADTRWTYGTLPSRNSSWGSYDIRPSVGYNNVTERDEKTQQNDDLESLISNSSSGMFSYDREAWYPGTVKRTKQKLEAESNTIKRVCSDSGVPMSHSSPPSSESSCDITSSSPPVISTATLRLQGPRPYQNPATTVTPVHPEQQQTTASGQPLVHYASSPTLCHKRLDEEMLSASVPEKMAISQPNISSYLSHSDTVKQQQSKQKLSELETNPLLVNILQCPPGKKVLEELVSKMQPNNGEVQLPDLLQSTSAPSVAKAVKQESGATWLSEEVSQPSTTPGVVKSLKKEFEAKSVRKEKATSVIVEASSVVIKDGDTSSPELRVKCGSEKVKSLPSSPVSTTCPPQSISTSGTPVEDLTVKRLVDKFEVNHNGEPPSFLRSISDSPPVGRPRFLSENNSSSTKRKSSPAGLSLQPPVPPRKSSFEVTAASGANILARNMKNGTENRINRLPPTTQPVLLGLAKPKKQQGKTHPLARLTFNKPRHNNPVYNTM